jgi:hypothetical protein
MTMPPPVQPGEVWQYRTDTTTMRVVILSGPVYNAAGRPLAAQLLRRPAAGPPTGRLGPFRILTGDTDSINGVVCLTLLVRCRPDGLTAPVTVLSGETWYRVRGGVRLMMDVNG